MSAGAGGGTTSEGDADAAGVGAAGAGGATSAIEAGGAEIGGVETVGGDAGVKEFPTDHDPNAPANNSNMTATTPVPGSTNRNIPSPLPTDARV